MSNAIQLGILSNERIKDSYKLAKEKEVEFDADDFQIIKLWERGV